MVFTRKDQRASTSRGKNNGNWKIAVRVENGVSKWWISAPSTGNTWVHVASSTPENVAYIGVTMHTRLNSSPPGHAQLLDSSFFQNDLVIGGTHGGGHTTPYAEVTYGGDDGKKFTARNCESVGVLNTQLRCTTSPGGILAQHM